MENEAVNKSAGNVRSWMIVDDSPEFLEFLREAAAFYTNCKIECYEDAHTALAAFEAAPESFEFVITDLEMPEMNGEEFCRRIRAASASVKVMLATGKWGVEPADVERKGFCGLLKKPFPLTDLARALSGIGIGKAGVTLTSLMTLA